MAIIKQIRDLKADFRCLKTLKMPVLGPSQRFLMSFCSKRGSWKVSQANKCLCYRLGRPSNHFESRVLTPGPCFMPLAIDQTASLLIFSCLEAVLISFL